MMPAKERERERKLIHLNLLSRPTFNGISGVRQLPNFLTQLIRPRYNTTATARSRYFL